ncbi:hypothetical protein [Desulfonatronum thioautotrophicum]|uniref:hypothetical protein n=1 Tax=Desulfonatronum thioautotrophicum TaxID=617001 RepID=UPI0005EB090A|nr:hypothetical protein [Desulfonatronum thioautotrophicum]
MELAPWNRARSVAGEVGIPIRGKDEAGVVAAVKAAKAWDKGGKYGDKTAGALRKTAGLLRRRHPFRPTLAHGQVQMACPAPVPGSDTCVYIDTRT